MPSPWAGQPTQGTLPSAPAEQQPVPRRQVTAPLARLPASRDLRCQEPGEVVLEFLPALGTEEL